jgi:hypothetical protein
MDRAGRGHDAQPLTKPLDSAQFVTPRHVLPLPCRENKIPAVELLPSVQMTPQLETEWTSLSFAPLP